MLGSMGEYLTLKDKRWQALHETTRQGHVVRSSGKRISEQNQVE